ncbi:MAG TPA: thioredoxin family protein [Candidatus Nanoarchaeia archaeon]|nr:thioredoxin family protein [Candidatus Nanoarchaeia archaeon]
MNFIKKPFVALVVMVLVAAAIIFVEMQKPNVNFANNSTLEGKNSQYQKAPDFIGISRWINSEPLKVESLKGKIVLVDFWTYTCINCIRTLPYLKDWDAKYRDKGLVIVGVHSPEFEFEKKYENVLKAVNDYQIKYPVAQDNHYATWSAYQNRYWPHKFLIDINGYIRYDHIGEGNYGETEMMIQTLLQERMERLNKKNGVSVNLTKAPESSDFGEIGTPEIYFGYQFTRGNIGYANIPQDSVIDYKLPPNAAKNYVYLSGKWKNNADNMELASDEGLILLIFQAKKINIVAGSENKSDAYVLLDTDFENEKTKGSDVELQGNKSIVNIKEFKIYNIASAEGYGTHIIELQLAGKGFKIYTFTFG